MELNDAAQIISYEEYYPYGSTSYQAGRNRTDAPKRCRYSGKERDEETGFAYYGFRYYAFGLSRWTSADPASLQDGLNVYRFTRANPVIFVDLNGTDSHGPSHDEISDMEDVIEKVHFHGFEGIKLGGGSQSRAIVAFFEQLGESTGKDACTKESELDLFDRGTRIYASARDHASTYDLTMKFSLAARRGDQKMEDGALGLYDDYYNNAPVLMTKKEYQSFVYERDKSKLGLINMWAFGVNSMGLSGAPESGGAGPEGESSWGAKLEPQVISAKASSEIEGAPRKGDKSSFNPRKSEENCVDCTSAFLKSVKGKQLVTASDNSLWNGGSIEIAKDQIEASAGVRFGDFQFRTLNTAKDLQFFVVFPGASKKVAAHVLIGINNRGQTMIYDPQNHTKVFDISTFGPFTAYPVAFQ